MKIEYIVGIDREEQCTDEIHYMEHDQWHPYNKSENHGNAMEFPYWHKCKCRKFANVPPPIELHILDDSMVRQILISDIDSASNNLVGERSYERGKKHGWKEGQEFEREKIRQLVIELIHEGADITEVERRLNTPL